MFLRLAEHIADRRSARLAHRAASDFWLSSYALANHVDIVLIDPPAIRNFAVRSCLWLDEIAIAAIQALTPRRDNALELCDARFDLLSEINSKRRH